MEKNKLEFITEIASTHNGNIETVNKIFKNHLKSNSDYIKFQLLNTSEHIKILNFKKDFII